MFRWLSSGGGGWQDVRFALRMIRRGPAFAISSILLLALVIAINTALFSIVDAAWFRSLPYPDAGRIMGIWEKPPKNVQWKRQMLPFDDFVTFQRNNRSFEMVGASVPKQYTVMVDGHAESIAGEAVSPGYLRLLGIPSLKGRLFSPLDGSGTTQVVLSFSLWSRLFNRQPVIGRTIALNSKPYTIAGIMPSTFVFPSLDEDDPALWTVLEPSDRGLRGGRVSVIGRLRPSITAKAAEAEAAALLRSAHERVPASNRPQGMMVKKLQLDRAEFSTPALLVLCAGVAFVLLIACTNVAGLMLGRAWERRQEMAIRYSLGAPRARVIRQLLTEHLLLWAVAGGSGLLLSVVGLKTLVLRFASSLLPEFPHLNAITMDGRVVAYSLLLTLTTGLIFGLIPALYGSPLDISGTLKDSGRGIIASRRTRVWRRVLVIAEVGFCVMLLVGAGLLLRSLVNLTEQPLGFQAADTVTFKADLSGKNYEKPSQRYEFYDRLLEQLRHIPGVLSAAATSSPPLRGTVVFGFSILSHSDSGRGFLLAGNEAISPEYFRTIGMPVIAGRVFDEHDSEWTQHVAVINKTLARHYFGDQNPVGMRIKEGDITSKAPWMTIVGVVGDVKHAGLDWEYLPEIYMPYRQIPSGFEGIVPEMFFVLRMKGEESVISGIQAAVGSIDAGVPVSDVMPMHELIEAKELPSQLKTGVFAVFGALSLTLAAVGLYAIVSQSVLQRRNEIGIRVALGASPREVLGSTVVEGLQLSAAGAALGLAGSLALTRLLSSLLYGVSITDPIVFVCVPVLLLLVASAASFIPAVKAAATDPLETLRCE